MMANKSLGLIVTVEMLVCSSFYCLASSNPGFRAAVTQTGLDYLSNVSLPFLVNQLKEHSISGTVKLLSQSVKYEIKNVQVTEVGDGRLSLKSSPAGLVLKADNVSLNISADWNISVPLLGIFTGSLNGTADEMSFKIEFRITSNNQGHPQINATSCSFEIQDISLEFTSPLLNQMYDSFQDELKRQSEELVCDKLIKNQLRHLNEKIASSSLVIELDKFAGVSYILMGQPTYTAEQVQIDLKGEFLSLTQPNVKFPFIPPPLPTSPPSIKTSSKMMYLWASEYVANTAALVYMRAGKLCYNITADSLKDKHHKVFLGLNTTTFSFFAPELYHRFPRKELLLTIRAVKKPPNVVITEQGVSISSTGAVDVYVLTGSIMPLAFTLGFTADVSARVWLENGTKNSTFTIKANATDVRIHITLLKSNVGHIDVDKINLLNKGLRLTQEKIIPSINKVANKGYLVHNPTAEGLIFHHTSVDFHKGYAIVGMDITYDPVPRN